MLRFIQKIASTAWHKAMKIEVKILSNVSWFHFKNSAYEYVPLDNNNVGWWLVETKVKVI